MKRRMLFLVAGSALLTACSAIGSNAAHAPDSVPSGSMTSAGTVITSATSIPSTVAIAATRTPLTAIDAAPARGCEASKLPDLDPSYAPPISDLPLRPAILDTGATATTLSGARSDGFVAAMPQAIPGNRSLVNVLEDRSEDGQATGVRLYFASTAISDSETITDYFDRGGILLLDRVSEGRSASLVVAAVGKRATVIAVGSFDAALVWADPIDSAGTRTYNIYWSDGSHDWSVEAAVASPDVVVDMARSIYC